MNAYLCVRLVCACAWFVRVSANTINREKLNVKFSVRALWVYLALSDTTHGWSCLCMKMACYYFTSKQLQSDIARMRIPWYTYSRQCVNDPCAIWRLLNCLLFPTVCMHARVRELSLHRDPCKHVLLTLVVE